VVEPPAPSPSQADSKSADLKPPAPKKPEVEAWLRVAQGMVVRGFGTTKLIRAYDASVHGAHGDTT
jgi:hypothetical protein